MTLLTLIPLEGGIFPPGLLTSITFWICAVFAIAGALGVVFFQKPIYSALSLALVMVSLAVLYASLNAPFLFAVQIIVYTGAVLMLFLFVVMLVGVDTHDSVTETLKGHRIAVTVAGLGTIALLVLAVGNAVTTEPVGLEEANASGNVQGLAELVFQRYVIAFEATAALLISAAVAAMVLAHPTRLKPKLDQTAMAERRMQAYAASGRHPGALPNSGVFARHNSIATPALLPDGTVAPDSVSAIIEERVSIPSAEELSAPHAEAVAAIAGGPGEIDADQIPAVERGHDHPGLSNPAEKEGDDHE
jgi:NADH-quinone oxidoreductase subunit J